MTKREVVRAVLAGERPPYVPWSCGFTAEAREKLAVVAPGGDLESLVQDHVLRLGSGTGFFEDLGQDRVRDAFGVTWNRSVDRDIGVVEGLVLPAPSLSGYDFPDPLDPRFFADMESRIARRGDLYRVFQIGFSLYERAWTLRGMENLLVDFLEEPDFAHRLLREIADWDIAQAREALRRDIDAVYFGDDWGQQVGLQMGPALWREFILPELRRMYGAVREEGRLVFIHSCGDVDELFPDLVEAGVSCFNPFQPEVMDVEALLGEWRGRLCFHGGLSTQRTLPYGSPAEVRAETRWLLELGRDGGYIFAPAHDVEGDVSVENMLAFLEVVEGQPGFAGASGGRAGT